MDLRESSVKRAIVQIDGGHLRSLALSKHLKFDPDFIERFTKSLLQIEEEPIRFLYYDCAQFEGRRKLPISGDEKIFTKSDEWLHDLASRELFAVRLGVLKFRGWRPKKTGATAKDEDFQPDFEQKGVDLRIGLDIATYSIPRTIDRIIILTGDTDLIPAMKLARRNGVQVIGVETPGRNLSREMLAHLDFKRQAIWP